MDFSWTRTLPAMFEDNYPRDGDSSCHEWAPGKKEEREGGREEVRDGGRKREREREREREGEGEREGGREEEREREIGKILSSIHRHAAV